MVIARIESLILEKGMNDALMRAEAYLNAGADGIMIQSKKKDPREIFEFCQHYNNFNNRKPLFVVPSSFNSVTEEELQSRGVNVVVYANYLLRSAYPAMIATANSILKHKRSLECDHTLLPAEKILEFIPGIK